MLRLLELALFLSPFIAFALWRVMAPVRGPSPVAVAVWLVPCHVLAPPVALDT